MTRDTHPQFCYTRVVNHHKTGPFLLTLLFYCSVIRSVLEYACQVFHCNLPLYLSDEIERIQRRALRIIFPACCYREGLVKAAFRFYMTEEVNCARNYSATLSRVTTN